MRYIQLEAKIGYLPTHRATANVNGPTNYKTPASFMDFTYCSH